MRRAATVPPAAVSTIASCAIARARWSGSGTERATLSARSCCPASARLPATIQFGQASEKITIHRDERTFVAQFHVDVRDEANRPATVLCYGHIPWVLQHGTDHHGERLLRDFLERRGIPWTNRIRNRYAAVCRELSKQPGPLTSFLGKLLQPPPSGPPKPAPAVRLEPRPRRDKGPPPVDEAPPPGDEVPPPVTEVIPEKKILLETQTLPDTEIFCDAESDIDAMPLPEADPRPEAEAALPETELPAHPLPDEPASDRWPSESATGGSEDA